MDKLHLMTVYVAVAEEEGFAAGARRLKMSPPAVTRAISTLENNLGVKLLDRTTRYVRCTEAGVRYLNDAKDIFSETLSRAIVEVSYENEEAFETLVSSKDQYCMKMGKVKGDAISINGIHKSLEDAKDVYFNKFRQVIEQDL